MLNDSRWSISGATRSYVLPSLCIQGNHPDEATRYTRHCTPAIAACERATGHRRTYAPPTMLPTKPASNCRVLTILMKTSIAQTSILNILIIIIIICGNARTHAGKEKNILDLLRSMTDPTGPFVVSSRPYLHGKRSGTALPFCQKLQILLMLGPHLCFVVGNMMLHHPATFPMGAIAPVSFLWRPLPNPSSDHTDVRRQLWVWVHPSASAELLQAFHKVASQHEGKAALALCAWPNGLPPHSLFVLSSQQSSGLRLKTNWCVSSLRDRTATPSSPRPCALLPAERRQV